MYLRRKEREKERKKKRKLYVPRRSPRPYHKNLPVYSNVNGRHSKFPRSTIHSSGTHSYFPPPPIFKAPFFPLKASPAPGRVKYHRGRADDETHDGDEGTHRALAGEHRQADDTSSRDPFSFTRSRTCLDSVGVPWLSIFALNICSKSYAFLNPLLDGRAFLPSDFCRSRTACPIVSILAYHRLNFKER